jgi:predicted transcriptional regulator
MEKLERLAPVEWEIMEGIWRLGGAPTVREVWEHLYPAGEKAYTTVQTMMNNLEKKGYLRRQKIGLVNFYTPLLERERAVRTEANDLLSRVFRGSVTSMATHLINIREMTLEDLESIRAILESRAGELKGERDDG